MRVARTLMALKERAVYGRRSSSSQVFGPSFRRERKFRAPLDRFYKRVVQ